MVIEVDTQPLDFDRHYFKQIHSKLPCPGYAHQHIKPSSFCDSTNQKQIRNETHNQIPGRLPPHEIFRFVFEVKVDHGSDFITFW
jgi:hypothetical protein